MLFQIVLLRVKSWSLLHMDRELASLSPGLLSIFSKISPMFDIDAGFKSIVDTDIDTLP